MKREFYILIFILISGFSPLFSQDFEVAPVVLKFNLEPGETETKLINITNHEAESKTFELKLFDYTVDDEGRRQNKPVGSTSRSLGEWLSISPSIVVIEPNQQITSEITISVPKEHYESRWAVIGVQIVKEKKMSDVDKKLGAGVIITPRIAVQISQSPNSNVNFIGKLQEFKQIEGVNDTLATFAAKVVNLGDKIISGKVYLTVADINTGEEKNYPPVNVKVYPESKKNIQLQIPEVLSSGNYAVAAIFDYGSMNDLEGAQVMLQIP